MCTLEGARFVPKAAVMNMRNDTKVMRTLCENLTYRVSTKSLSQRSIAASQQRLHEYWPTILAGHLFAAVLDICRICRWQISLSRLKALVPLFACWEFMWLDMRPTDEFSVDLAARTPQWCWWWWLRCVDTETDSTVHREQKEQDRKKAGQKERRKMFGTLEEGFL